MRILVSGASGLIGRALTTRLEAEGHRVVPLERVKAPSSPEADHWEPIRRESWDRDIGAVDAVVHLAGEPVAAKRWSNRQKERIRTSRVVGTRQLCSFLADLKPRPKVVIAASATGYYGDRGDDILTEDSSAGDGFLAEVCQNWEAACAPADRASIRVVNLRIGMVLSNRGGGLRKLIPLFKAGLGGKLGSGRQYVSWITLDDLVESIMFALQNESISGPVNAVSPNPVTNREFTKALGRALHRPTFAAVPAFALRLAVGEMADQMLLVSARVEPRHLLDAGFRFSHPELQPALDAIL
jgi:uncharacterized protein (TIGR01777 family)